LVFWTRHTDGADDGEGAAQRKTSILDLETRGRRKLALDCKRVDWSWHTDGRRLILTRWRRYSDDGSVEPLQPVTLFDVDTGEGSAPIDRAEVAFADSTGNRIWIGSHRDPLWHVVDPDTVASEERTCPWMLPFAASGDLVLGWAHPTEGVEQEYKWTLQKFPQAMWTVKLFDTASCEFVTVYDWAARFHRATFGVR
jgi:hypothetical protein